MIEGCGLIVYLFLDFEMFMLFIMLWSILELGMREIGKCVEKVVR